MISLQSKGRVFSNTTVQKHQFFGAQLSLWSNSHILAATAKSLQSCPTLCDPIDGSHQAPHPWDSPGKNAGVGCHFLLQCMKVKSLSPVRLLATPWTAAYQAPPSMGFSRQEYWSGVPSPSPNSCKPISPWAFLLLYTPC